MVLSQFDRFRMTPSKSEKIPRPTWPIRRVFLYKTNEREEQLMSCLTDGLRPVIFERVGFGPIFKGAEAWRQASLMEKQFSISRSNNSTVICSQIMLISRKGSDGCSKAKPIQSSSPTQAPRLKAHTEGTATMFFFNLFSLPRIFYFHL